MYQQIETVVIHFLLNYVGIGKIMELWNSPKLQGFRTLVSLAILGLAYEARRYGIAPLDQPDVWTGIKGTFGTTAVLGLYEKFQRTHPHAEIIQGALDAMADNLKQAQAKAADAVVAAAPAAKVLVLVAALTALAFGPRPCYAAMSADENQFLAASNAAEADVAALTEQAAVPTVNDALASFKGELYKTPEPTVLDNVFVAYDHDLRNGSDGVMVGTSFFQWAFLTADFGMATPTDKRPGTPLLGGSIHFDRLLDIVAPQLMAAVRAKFPVSSQKFLPHMYAGGAPVYNWNSSPNQVPLGVHVWTGLEYAW